MGLGLPFFRDVVTLIFVTCR